MFQSSKVKAGYIIVRQRGTKFKPGMQVGCVETIHYSH
jgi:ribosomal protein L27